MPPHHCWCTNSTYDGLGKYADAPDCTHVQGDFFNWPSPENVSRLAPPKFAWTGPPLNFVSVGIIFTSPDT